MDSTEQRLARTGRKYEDGDEVDDRPTTTTDEDDDEPPWGSKGEFMFSAPRQVRERGGHVTKGSPALGPRSFPPFHLL